MSRNIIWWVLYMGIALWLQLRLAGLDVLVPGLLLALQERRWQQTLWVMLFCILVQEGTGTLAFGTTTLWYGSLVLLFYAGRCFFEVSSLFFVLLISMGMGTLLGTILMTLGSLQLITFSTPLLIEQSIAQTMIIPPLWFFAMYTRKRFYRHAEDAV